MSPVESLSLNQIARGNPLGTDVWFLSGALQPGDSIRHLPIDESPYDVGRKTGVSLKIGFSTVSGRHASLWVQENRLHLKDHNSTNGTYVNGTRVSDEVVLQEEDLIHFAEAPFRVLCQSPISQTAGTIAKNVCEEALALVQFDRMMSERLVRPHFQSIVDLTTKSSVGFEILGRGSVFGLESVGAMFHAAEQLNLEVELSRLLRWEGVRLGRDISGAPELFVNTHPKEIEDINGLTDSLTKIREMANRTPIVLEIHEAAVTNRKTMRQLASALKDLGIRWAFDDFGSGQARLAELVEARPDFVKFDISLIRAIDAAESSRRRMMISLVDMVRELDIMALAEGIETPDEAEACIDIGFDLAQGYHFGRPAAIER
jgi:EAL domain-containing protein (putative c-di-GMP-specific phosphodiesterase class I)